MAPVKRIHQLKPKGINHSECGRDNKELQDDHRGA
jgi:hypothetical protein